MENNIKHSVYSSYRMLYCGHKDSSANYWKLPKERHQVKHLQSTNCCLKIYVTTERGVSVIVDSLAPPVLIEALPFLPSCWSFKVSYTIWMTGILKACRRTRSERLCLRATHYTSLCHTCVLNHVPQFCHCQFLLPENANICNNCIVKYVRECHGCRLHLPWAHPLHPELEE